MKRFIALCMICLMVFVTPAYAGAATPLISEKKAFPRDCYFHYDGQIWVYSTSKYKAEVKKAVKLLNKKYKVFRYTASKTKRDVWVKDKAKTASKRTFAHTVHDTGTITLYKNNMKRLSKQKKILTIAHELCHAAGLDHAKSKSSLMYPYMDKMKAKGLSKEDIKALKKAKKRANADIKGRKALLNDFLKWERQDLRIGLRLDPAGHNTRVLAFSKRGTTYQSSNPAVLEILPTGVMTVKKPGIVILTVHNAGTKHVFEIEVME